MSASKQRVHVLPAQGAATLVGRKGYWVFLSTYDELPDSLDAPEGTLSSVDARLLVASPDGKDAYLGELLGEGWYECRACSQRRYCRAWDGIGSRLAGVPVGILREGDRIDGDEMELMKLGFLGGEDIRRVATGASVIADAMAKLFGFVSVLRSTAPQSHPPEVMAAASELGIQWPATRSEIDAAFKSLAFRYHPDNKDHGSATKFVAIKQARDLLVKFAKEAT